MQILADRMRAAWSVLQKKGMRTNTREWTQTSNELVVLKHDTGEAVTIDNVT